MEFGECGGREVSFVLAHTEVDDIDLETAGRDIEGLY